MKKSKMNLREGFTTGSAATAAAMAAFEFLLNGGKRLDEMSIPIPPSEELPLLCPSEKDFLHIPIGGIRKNNMCSATAFVIKDAGDDPDVTNKAQIYATVNINVENSETIQYEKQQARQQDFYKKVFIKGGEGVGRITLPGLPVEVGMCAINPAPRRQITLGLWLVALKYNFNHNVKVIISVPKGAELAKKTFNPRLGIIGGISILGTQGIVKPYSNQAWKNTILQGLKIAATIECKTVYLSTGRRSEKLLLDTYPNIKIESCIQAADFVKFSLEQAGLLSFEQIIWGCFFGKLVKLAQGHSYTHAKACAIDFKILQEWCVKEGMQKFPNCVTANYALEYILQHENWSTILNKITQKAANVASNFAKKTVTVHLFHLDKRSLSCAKANFE